ncbi:cytochrome c oxidase accessory protein CcoG [Zavarzinia sp. CC-PAN008]|uniref:cytochrome c oxidase accessory protein CcoG n=1 Tax=Zavarzinia sp. CC-PAN008 TaxID=3243332 RepID=UPI003F748B90
MSVPDSVSSPEAPHLFEARRQIHPRSVDGVYRRLKWAIMVVTLTIYYVTPWLRWDRGPYAPDQAVLVDLANRRFFMFSIEIWPHEFYYVAGLLIMAGVGLFLVTSAVGRAWCGYACPQTVWTDLFLHVERLIDGDRNAQIKLERGPWTLDKVVKRAAKHSAWLLIALATGGAWIFYFADAPTLARSFVSGEAPFVAYGTVMTLTATTYILGGLLREQVCIYMCPWPRIQGAMMDEQSLTVTYKHWRGEPRTHGTKRTAVDLPAQKVGDCIDCNACVAVCPTGIDIRQGSQIGCITCGLCIDACDQVMEKLERPTRLIGYTTSLDSSLAIAGKPTMPALKRLLRPRTLVYFSVWGAIGLGMLFMLGQRDRIDIHALQDRNPTWVRLSDGSIRNTYTINVRNMQNRPRTMEISLDGLAQAQLWAEDGTRERAGRSVQVTVPADQVAKTRLFIAAPAMGEPREALAFVVRALDEEGGEAADESFFERPEGGR